MEANRIIQGDCIGVLKTIPDNSIDTIKISREKMDKMSDLQIGTAGEYLVCADLLLKGYNAYPSIGQLSYDVILDVNGQLYKIQVKTTRRPAPVPQRKNRTDKYIVNIRRCGKGGRRSYRDDEVDIFAIVALDTKTIGYIKASEAKQTMFFLPENGFVAVNGKGRGKTGLSAKKLSDYKIEEVLK